MCWPISRHSALSLHRTPPPAVCRRTRAIASSSTHFCTSSRSTALVAAASQLLSSVTHLAGVVTLPRTQQASITQIEFLGLSEKRVLVVLVLDNREVQNRIIHLERAFSADELKRASNYLNEQCRGRTLPQVRQEILRQLKEAHEHMSQMMLNAITVAQQVFTGREDEQLEYVIAGETNLMGELTSVERLRRLFEAF